MYFSVMLITSSVKGSRVKKTVRSITGYKCGVMQEKTFRLFLPLCKIGNINKYRQEKEENRRDRNKERWRKRRGTKRRKLMGHMVISIKRLANAE